MEIQKVAKLADKNKLTCEKCNKKYKSVSGLWKHKQKCDTIIENIETSNDVIESSLIIQLMNLVDHNN